MKAYGRKNPKRYGASKDRTHSRKGNVCPICNNTKISKGSARQKTKRFMNEECASYFYGADIRGSRDRSGISEQEGRAA